MIELWTVLTPILLADVVNPVLFAFLVFTAGTNRPLVNTLSALVGHTIAYLAFGIVLAFAFQSITEWLSNPGIVDYTIGLLIGFILLWVAWQSRSADKQENAKAKPQEDTLTPLKAFGLGTLINIIGLPFALPYFAALNKIFEANLSIADSLLVIGGYNLGYALPFLIVPILTVILGERSRPILAAINDKVTKVSVVIMPVMLGLVGLAFIADATYYFTTGKGLF